MIEEKLRAIEEEEGSATPSGREREEDMNDIMAKVNERNRMRNLEIIRKAEADAAMKKRMERKALMMNGTGSPAPQSDPSARLKTVPKVFNNRSRCVFFPCLFERVVLGLHELSFFTGLVHLVER